jgi:pimeloyl-ACP methyl ester carboxylesterase
MPSIRLLCLHGYRGNSAILRRQMAPFVHGLESVAEFVTVDAPSLAEGDFGWWHGNFPSSTGDYRGWDRTRDWIVRLFAHERHFDGVLGFSQGAALTGVLAGMRSMDGRVSDQAPLLFDFAIMIGGFRSEMPAHQEMYAATGRYTLPSLHIMGGSDSIVPAADSRRLAGQFNSPLILEHPGGHVIPDTPSVRDQVAVFFREMAERKSSLATAPRMQSRDSARQS